MSRFGRWRTTRLGALPNVTAFLLFMLSVLTGSRWLLLLTGACFGLMVAAVILRPNVSGLVFTVTGPVRAAVGDTVTHHVRVDNSSSRATSAGRVTLTVPGFEDATFAVDGLIAGGTADVTLHRRAVARTVGHQAVLVTASSTPFGMLEARSVALCAMPVTVHPQPARARRMPAGSAVGTADAVPVQTRSGLDFHGIREWRTGDSARDVHWRSSARRGRLVVVEREEPQQRALTMLVPGTPDAPDWETVLAEAAASAAAVARSGREVTLVARQRGLAPLTTSRGVDVLDWFAGLGETELGEADDVQHALASAGHGGDVVVVTTSALPPAWYAWLRAAAARRAVTVHPFEAGAR